MPIYDYVCEACGRTFEVMHGVHAERPTSCEACGGRLRKAMSAPAIVFKGSGWAKVDARSKASPAASGKADGATSDSDKAATAPDKAATAPDKAATASSKATPAADKGTPAAASAGADSSTKATTGGSPTD